MRFMHLADLHLGKSIYNLSLIDSGDQRVWVDRFLDLAREQKPDAVLIAGDVYDRGLPPGKAAQLLGHLVTELARMDITVMITAGNHDSVYHLSFLAPLLEDRKVYISRPLDHDPELARATLHDEHGPVTFWLLPYVYPAMIANVLQDESIRDYDTAVRRILQAQPIDFTQRNVIIAHQFVTADGQEGARGGSETTVGGVGQVDHSAFDGFEYAALGHIHAAYPVGREQVRYAGSPLCYHFNETKQDKKGPLLVTLPQKGVPPAIERLDIAPLHRMREIRGTYDEIRREAVERPRENEYLKIVLTDTRVTPDISSFLNEAFQARGSRVLELSSEFDPFTGRTVFTGAKDMREIPVERLFADFYKERNNGTGPDERDAELMTFVGELTRKAAAGRADPDEQEFRAILDHLERQEVENK